MTDTPADAPARDYRGTVFLPQTDFPMKGDLPKREPNGWSAGRRWTSGRSCGSSPPAGRSSSCMTARPMPTATCTSATR